MASLILLRLTLQGVVADVPHDAAAWITYVLLALFVAFVWSGSRSRA